MWARTAVRANLPIKEMLVAQDHLDWKHGRPPRLPWYDYASAGGYFITINTFQRKPLFGALHNGRVLLSDFGRIAQGDWLRTQEIRSEILLDQFVIMPDHVHGIVVISDPKRTNG